LRFFFAQGTLKIKGIQVQSRLGKWIAFGKSMQTIFLLMVVYAA
jgi:hypothetical protein